MLFEVSEQSFLSDVCQSRSSDGLKFRGSIFREAATVLDFLTLENPVCWDGGRKELCCQVCSLALCLKRFDCKFNLSCWSENCTIRKNRMLTVGLVR